MRRCLAKKEEDTVNMNKSKAEPVSSWCHQRQAGSTKVFQRVVWSLIFLVFGVCRAKAEELEIHAQKMREKYFYPNRRVDIRWKRMLSWRNCAWKGDVGVLGKEEKRKKKHPCKGPQENQVKDQRTTNGRSHREERWPVQEKRKEEKEEEKEEKEK